MAEAKGVANRDRVIVSSEVKEWFQSPRTPAPSDMACEEIAAFLTKMRWRGDPPDDLNSPWIPKQKTSAEEWWDFPGATDAVKMLLTSMPAMLAHWEQLRWAPETSAGYEAIKAFGDALSLALPYIEWPLGEYERRIPQARPKKKKDWHVASAHIAGEVLRATQHRSLAKKSIVVRVVSRALVRMGYSHQQESTISKYLIRWKDKFGKLPGTTK